MYIVHQEGVIYGIGRTAKEAREDAVKMSGLSKSEEGEMSVARASDRLTKAVERYGGK